MARLKNKVKEGDIERLRKLIAQTYGKPLQHSFECERLSTEVKKVTGNYVSPQTLRRLLGFLTSDFSPSIRTLNTLAAYTGHFDWYLFGEQNSESQFQPLTLDDEANLYLDFYKIEMKEEADMNYHNASRNIAFRILFNPVLLAKLSPALASNPVSQIYFFERFPYIDGLCTDYKRGIKLYLQKKGAEAQLFGNALLFLSAFLSGDRKKQTFYCNRINQYSVDANLHPFIVARYIGSNLLYAIANDKPYEKWMDEARQWNRHFLLKTNKSIWEFPYFQHMMALYLNIAGLPGESYEIIHTIKHLRKPLEIEKGYEEALKINYQVAHISVSPDDFIEWMVSAEELSSINPLFRKLYELLVSNACRCILPAGRKKEKICQRISELVEQTGFTYFLDYQLR